VQILNDPWPWFGTLRGHPLEIADLIAADTLTPESAATLAWTIERGASAFVAAGPPGAGKSTIANALLQFVPEDAGVYVTAGAWDRLQLPDASGPIYLLINELSAHMPMYLSGRAAQRAFELTSDGVRLFGTLHARNSAEAIRVMCYEAGLPPGEIQGAFVFAVVRAGWNGPRIERRVVEIGFAPDCLQSPISLLPASDGLDVLAKWAGTSAETVTREIAQRAAEIAAVARAR
jgi:type IV secretory pathway ATPase VirB11/archaellum biosynthesis ATPase